jgi:hypothetical protein
LIMADPPKPPRSFGGMFNRDVQFRKERTLMFLVLLIHFPRHGAELLLLRSFFAGEICRGTAVGAAAAGRASGQPEADNVRSIFTNN